MSARPSKAALARLLRRSTFVGGYGLRLHSVDNEQCTIAMPFRRSFERPGGTVNGPAFMAAADCAMWLAIKRHIGMEQDAVTSELNTAFLNAARRQTVYCTARILKLGKRIIYGSAECHDGKGRLFTHHTVTYARI
ncbi:MAG TPA: PaaI family thioesterase [Burkholderiales bacterium]|nr:PaaI family thioesterase [Burkholderiales bacterium]